MSFSEQFLTILIVLASLQFCRWVAFWVFPANKPVPSYIQYLGQVLPASVFGLLVVYCYKNTDIFSQYHGAAEFIAGAMVVILHICFRNMFISIGVGTVLYMYLIQQVFI